MPPAAPSRRLPLFGPRSGQAPHGSEPVAGPSTSGRWIIALAALVVLGTTGCGDDDDHDNADDVGGSIEVAVTEHLPTPGRSSDGPAGRSALGPDSTWQWQLQGTINTGYDVDVYDIDLFDTDPAVIGELHGAGRIVICYFSAGSYEEWRDDASSFAAEDLGEPLDGWEGERWLDVRADGVRAVMLDRLDLAVAKGCDGVEPDNVTAFNNDTGFDVTSEDQIDFNRFLAEAAHSRSLLIGLKNDLDQIPTLVDHFDFAVNEECFQYDECDAYLPFLDVGKPVFNAEYAEEFVADPADVCNRARAVGLRTLILSLDLDDSLRISCDR